MSRSVAFSASCAFSARSSTLRQDRDGVAPLDHAMHVAQRLQEVRAFDSDLHCSTRRTFLNAAVAARPMAPEARERLDEVARKGTDWPAAARQVWASGPAARTGLTGGKFTASGREPGVECLAYSCSMRFRSSTSSRSDGVLADQRLDLAHGVQHGGVVAPAEAAADLGQRAQRQHLRQIHRDLARLHHGGGAALGQDVGRG